MASPVEILRCLEVIERVFREELDPPTSKIYIAALADIPLPQLQAAVMQIIRGARYFPRPAEIR